MKIDELCEHLRTKSEPLRLDQVHIFAATETRLAHGTMSIEGEEFVVKLRIEGEELDWPKAREYNREEFWRFVGLIDDEIPFEALGLPHTFGHRRITLNVDLISLVPKPTDAEIKRKEELRVETEEMLDRIFKKRGRIRHSTSFDPPPRFYGNARLSKAHIIARNTAVETSTTVDDVVEGKSKMFDMFKGMAGKCSYSLRQEGDDLLIKMKSPPDEVYERETFETEFDWLLQSFGMVTGQNVWPQEWKLGRNSEILAHTVRPPINNAGSQYPMITEWAWMQGANFAVAMSSAFQYLKLHPVVGKKLAMLMYLAREAGAEDTSHETGTLALCSIFEGMIELLYEEHCRVAESAEEQKFNRAKSEIEAICRKRSESGEQEFERLARIVGSARLLRPIEKLKHIVFHFGVDYDTDFSEIIDAWNAQRHPLAHGRMHRERPKGVFTAPSRIAGGINILLATAIGYRGKLVSSATEAATIIL